MLKTSDSSQRLLKGLLLFLGVLAFAIVFGFSFSVFRDGLWVSENNQEPTPPTTAPSEPSGRILFGSLAFTGSITELITDTDSAKGKWITIFVESPEDIHEVVKDTDNPEKIESAKKPFPAEMANKAYKFFLSKDSTEGMSAIRGGERVTVLIEGIPQQTDYTTAKKVDIIY